jgi:hypothetical protein
MAKIKAYHTCTSRPAGFVQEVTLDVENGSAWFGNPEDMNWFPIYKSCCSFYEDEACTIKIDTEGIPPVLDLTGLEVIDF